MEVTSLLWPFQKTAKQSRLGLLERIMKSGIRHTLWCFCYSDVQYRSVTAGWHAVATEMSQTSTVATHRYFWHIHRATATAGNILLSQGCIFQPQESILLSQGCIFDGRYTAPRQLAGTTLTDANDNFTRQAVDPGIALGPVCNQRVVATTV